MAFVAAWAGAGAAADRYSPVDGAISDLAALGAGTRPWMTGGMVAFGLALPVFATGLRRAVDGQAWLAAVAAGLGSLAVAALPLDPARDVPQHAAAAAVAYVALALTPLLAAAPLRRAGQHRWARLSVLAGVTSGVLLGATAVPSGIDGLLQRAGLTVVDLWLVGAAIGLLGRPAGSGAAADA